jgi:hypothetical protein
MGLNELDAAQKDCWLLLHMDPKRPEVNPSPIFVAELLS